MKTYKERPKKETLLTIIMRPRVNSDEESNLLKGLSEFSDLFFIYTAEDGLYKNLRKFSNIYQAAFYGIGGIDQTEQEMIWEALLYAKELGEGYTGFALVNLAEITREDLESLKNLSQSLIETSVWEDRDLTHTELKDIYLKNNQFLREFAVPDRIKYILLRKDREDISRMYSTKTTEDPVIFIREITLDKLQSYFEADKIFYKSFRYADYREFLSSSISRICPETKINVRVNYAKS